MLLYFIGIYLIFIYKLMPDYTLILFLEIKWHKQLIIRIVKHKSYMYNENVRKLLKYSVVK